MLPKELLSYANILVRDIVPRNGRKPFVRASLTEIIAGGWAIDRALAPGPAAKGANISANARAIASRTLLFADFAGGIHRRMPPSYHWVMPRSDLYIKVELDIDEKENPDRVAAEICRLIRKVYGVRQAEVSSIVERDR
jgi:hypothetical protein